MAGKVMKFSEKVKKIKRSDSVVFATDDGAEIEFKVESRSQADVDLVNGKYDALKPKMPTKRLPAGQGKFKIVDDPDEPEFKKNYAKVQKRNFAELALLFLAEDERPEGDIESQIDQIMEVEVAGFVAKILNRGLELSGLIDEKTYDEEVSEAKND